jgi:hypothetical protein
MKTIITILAAAFCLSASAQEKKDTTIEIKLNINEYRAIMSAIDANIDSKKISKDLLEFIAKNAFIADKPKEIKK